MPSLDSVSKATILSTTKSRMGGEISRLRFPDGTNAFLKLGRGFERIELVREHRNLTVLGKSLPLPALLDFEDRGAEARLLIEAAPGAPLHEVYPVIGRQATLILIAQILRKLWTLSSQTREPAFGSVHEELADVRMLIDQHLIDEAGFQAASGGKTPTEMYTAITTDIASHDANVVSHGDFCLPNIIIDSANEWRLIDLGKAAISDRFRDLSTMQVSLARNVDDRAFDDLLSLLSVDFDETARKKIKAYRDIDLYWYNAKL